jgi:hypothetical protein
MNTCIISVQFTPDTASRRRTWLSCATLKGFFKWHQIVHKQKEKKIIIPMYKLQYRNSAAKLWLSDIHTNTHCSVQNNTFYFLYSKATCSNDVYHHKEFSINSQNQGECYYLWHLSNIEMYKNILIFHRVSMIIHFFEIFRMIVTILLKGIN